MHNLFSFALNWLTRTMEKIMSKLYLEDFSGDQVNIDSDQVYMVIIEGSVIIIIYKNATSERFPASPENINVAMDLIRAVKKIRATP